MGMIDLLRAPDYDNDQAKLADSVMRSYFRYRTADRAIDTIGGAFWEGAGEKRTRQNQELDIRLKRKQLGLPMDDEDYEDATNDDFPMRTFSRGALAAKHATQMIPEPAFLKQPAFFKYAHAVPSRSEFSAPFAPLISALGAFGSKRNGVSRIASSAARIFGR
jgi:hypothetical protein